MAGTETTARGFADVHAHLYDKRFGATLEETAQYLERAKSHGVGRCVCACASPGDWNRAAEIARKFPDVYLALGVHPWNCRRVSGEWLPALERLLDAFVGHDGVSKAALGEVGLDFAVRDCDDALRSEQEKIFRDQLQLADARKIPVTVHSVRSNERVLDVIREYSNVPAWLLHGWRATPSEIERAVEIGAFFSFSARFVAKNAARLREVVARVPRDRILVESDGPTPLPPDGYGTEEGDPPRPSISLQARDEDGFLLAEPASILATAKEIALIRRMPLDEFFRQLALNERRFFVNWPTVQKK